MNVSKMFGCMSNKARRQIFIAIKNAGEISAGDINKLVPTLSQSSLSQHLKVFRDSDMVETRRESTVIYYKLKTGFEMKRLSGFIEDICIA